MNDEFLTLLHLCLQNIFLFGIYPSNIFFSCTLQMKTECSRYDVKHAHHSLRKNKDAIEVTQLPIVCIAKDDDTISLKWPNDAQSRVLIQFESWIRVSWRSFLSIYSVLSVLSLASVLSVSSVASAMAFGSALSGASAGSFLSFGSVGSFMSIGSIGSFASIGCVGESFKMCW